jgi:hypothetical protein
LAFWAYFETKPMTKPCQIMCAHCILGPDLGT